MLAAQTRRTSWLLPGLLLLASGIFLTGIGWGLPSRSADPFLFGDRTPWTGKQILALAPDWGDDASRAADVAAHPLANRDQAIVVNQTDSQRAAIVRRYRLYSDQPDEMITLRALAQMKPGKLQFDPKLYQYGGLWIYPIAVALKMASAIHLVFLTPDIAFYFDHPEAFGRFYVVMRLYSAVWGLAGVAVMFSLASRISKSQIIGASTAICYMLLPTVINGAHEAKPHLAGAVLELIAVDFALRAVQNGRQRWLIAAGVASGAATSMVLTGGLCIFMLPAAAAWMVFDGREMVPHRGARIAGNLALALAAMGATYAACNPYVIVHLLGDRAVLQSNLENSAAMYQAPASIAGVLHGCRLLLDGGSPIIFFGAFAITFLAWRRSATAWLLLAGTVPGMCVFLMHATGKPGEYARFAMASDVLLIAGVAVGMSVFKRPMERAVVAVIICLMILPFGASYVLNYGRETFGGSTRLIVAAQIAQWTKQADGVIAVDADPAPYDLPPIDLQKNTIVLLPRHPAAHASWTLRVDPVDQVCADQPYEQYLIRPLLLPTPISWAGKSFRVEKPPDVDAAEKRQR